MKEVRYRCATGFGLNSIIRHPGQGPAELSRRSTEAVPGPYVEGTAPSTRLVGALWLRSIRRQESAGAEPADLQVDITPTKPIDDNAFQVETRTIVENSFNIHQDGPRFVFQEEENPQAKLMACARNDKLFTDGSDLTQLAKEVRYVIGGVRRSCEGPSA